MVAVEIRLSIDRFLAWQARCVWKNVPASVAAAVNIDPNYDFFFDVFLARLLHNPCAGKRETECM